MEERGSRIDRCDFISNLRSSIFNLQLGCGGLPFGLGRQTSAGPTAVGVGLVPVHVNDRPVSLQRQPTIKITAQPVTLMACHAFAAHRFGHSFVPRLSRPRKHATLGLPVNRMLGARFLAPAPTPFAPKSPLAVTPVVNEGSELLLGHRRPRQGEGLDFHRMCPLLIVKHKWFVWRRPEPEGAAGNLDIPQQRSIAF